MKKMVNIVIREMQIKTWGDSTSQWSEWPHHQKISRTINAGDGVEKKEHFYPVSGNINWHNIHEYNYYRDQYGGSLQNNIE